MGSKSLFIDILIRQTFLNVNGLHFVVLVAEVYYCHFSNGLHFVVLVAEVYYCHFSNGLHFVILVAEVC